jgi:hypothetical protein
MVGFAPIIDGRYKGPSQLKEDTTPNLAKKLEYRVRQTQVTVEVRTFLNPETDIVTRVQ